MQMRKPEDLHEAVLSHQRAKLEYVTENMILFLSRKNGLRYIYRSFFVCLNYGCLMSMFDEIAKFAR